MRHLTPQVAGAVLVMLLALPGCSGSAAICASAGGTYASLYESWLGNTRVEDQPAAGGPTAPISAR